jgi:hypothetical protein
MRYVVYPLVAAFIFGRPYKMNLVPAFFAAAMTSVFFCIEDNVPVIFDVPAYIRSLF